LKLNYCLDRRSILDHCYFGKLYFKNIMKFEDYKKISGQWKFLIIILIIYLIVFIVDFEFGKEAINNFLVMFGKVIAIAVVVFFIMFVLNLFIKPEIIKKHLGNESGLKGLFYIILASIFISGPPYVLMPMFSDFKE